MSTSCIFCKRIKILTRKYGKLDFNLNCTACDMRRKQVKAEPIVEARVIVDLARDVVIVQRKTAGDSETRLEVGKIALPPGQ